MGRHDPGRAKQGPSVANAISADYGRAERTNPTRKAACMRRTGHPRRRRWCSSKRATSDARMGPSPEQTMASVCIGAPDYGWGILESRRCHGSP